CPEAFSGGPIAIVEEGDMIQIDIERRELNLLISPEEMDKRLRNWTRPEPEINSGYLKIYRKLVAPSKYGAYLD
ncbi:MAG: dihydroxy-acid dehydratase, partial [Promethearchaeia archaeon]